VNSAVKYRLERNHIRRLRGRIAAIDHGALAAPGESRPGLRSREFRATRRKGPAWLAFIANNMLELVDEGGRTPMAKTATGAVKSSETIEHFDVLIVGAGISGVGGTYHLTKQCPGMSFVLLEAQDSFGGTWLTHRYPGIRSDSDLYTFGYRFKPWTSAPIATAAEILGYMGEVIDENDLGHHIRYRHKITRASWSSAEKLWTLEASRTDTGETRRFTADFLWMCQGYYRHAQGYTPEWTGMADYRGRIVHPQKWPEGLDYAGKRVVVIGSGATAATLIPAIAGECGHVTMLQRSPTWFRTGRNAIAIADELRELDIDETWIHEIVRKKTLHDQAVFTGRSFTEPEAVKRELLAAVRGYLGPDYDMETHFTPRYRPWRQRIAFIPDGDLLEPSAPARSVSLPTRSSGLPRPAFCCGPARFSTPTSSSPPPALISMCSATSILPSTASRSSSRTRSPIAA
jgi:cation diffusion facilitator CzcD-associated flavoprotein CzcO